MIKQQTPEQLQAAWHLQELYDVYYRNPELQELIDKARDIFERPLLVHDASFKILAASYDISEATTTSTDADGDRYLSDSAIRFIQEKHIAAKARKNSANYVEKPHPQGGTLVSAIRINGVETAHVAVHEAGIPFGKMEPLLIAEFSKLLSLQLQQNDTFLIDRNILPSYLFAELLEGKITNEDNLRKKLLHISWINTTALSILILTGPEQRISANKIPMIIQAVKAFVPVNHCTIFHSYLVAFLMPAMKKELLLRKEEFSDFLTANCLYAGMSMEFREITHSGKYLLQATKAAELATAKSFLLFEDCGLHLLSELVQSHYDLTDFTHPAVTALMKSDYETGGELLATLKYYIYYNHTPNEAAKILNIHRNTLFYRIGKIRDMTGISFDTVEDSFKIYLSIRLLEAAGELIL